jgi:hypothetical protein
LICAAALCCFGAGLAALASAAKNHDQLALGVILQLNSYILLFAAWLDRSDQHQLMPRKKLLNMSASEAGGVLIACGWILLFFQLVVRLLSFQHFGGSWAGLNFGKKCGNGDCELNIAFTLEATSFGHCAQGLLSAFLFRFDTVLLGWIYGERRDGVCALVAIYPVYNIIKRVMKHHKAFSTSSFCNNGMEWALGFLLGISIGLVLNAMARAKEKAIANPSERNGDIETAPQNGKGAIAKLVAGAMLLIVTVVAALMNGLSWDNVSVRKHKDDADTGVLLLFMLSIVGLLCVLFVPGGMGSGHQPPIVSADVETGVQAEQELVSATDDGVAMSEL